MTSSTAVTTGSTYGLKQYLLGACALGIVALFWCIGHDLPLSAQIPSAAVAVISVPWAILFVVMALLDLGSRARISIVDVIVGIGAAVFYLYLVAIGCGVVYVYWHFVLGR